MISYRIHGHEALNSGCHMTSCQQSLTRYARKALKTYLQQKKYILSCHQISKQNYDMTQNQAHAIILKQKLVLLFLICTILIFLKLPTLDIAKSHNSEYY